MRQQMLNCRSFLSALLLVSSALCLFAQEGKTASRMKPEDLPTSNLIIRAVRVFVFRT